MESLSLYSPLETWQIRLLRLLPAVSPEPLTGELVTAALLHANSGVILQGEFSRRQYTAFSYAWGQASLSFPIRLSGHEIHVTNTLGEALMHVRGKDEAIYLWVDAICINQMDNDEKAYQVQKMFDIFSTASKVMVWLGLEQEHTSHALRFIKDRPGSQDEEEVPATPPVLLDKLRRIVRAQRVYDPLLDLCTRPWNRRAWIQQEVFAAREVLVRCGHVDLQLEELQEAAALLANLDVLRIRRLSEDQRLSIEALRSIFQSLPSLKEKIAYMRCLGRTAGCHCQYYGEVPQSSTSPQCVAWRTRNIIASDPRDYVYALLGLTDCVTRPGSSCHAQGRNDILGIDYARSPSLVFQDLTKYIINTHAGSLGVLCGHVPGNDYVDIKLPSWCPDWRRPHHCLLPHPHVAYMAPQQYFDQDVLRFSGLVMAVRAVASEKRDIRLAVDIDENSFTIGSSAYAIDISESAVVWHVVPIIPWPDEYIAEGLAEYYHVTDGRVTDFQLGDIAVLPIRSELKDVHYWMEIPVLRPQPEGVYTFVGMLGLSLESNQGEMVNLLLDVPRSDFEVY